MNTENPTLRSALAALSPVHLRVGGSLADQITYNVNGSVDPCTEPAPDASEPLGFGQGCMPLARYDALHDLCRASGCQILFGLNGLIGRTPAPNTTELWTVRLIVPTSSCSLFPAASPSFSEFLSFYLSAPQGQWDPTNARELLEYTRRAGYSGTLAGVELGNEIDGAAGIAAKLPPGPYARDFFALKEILDETWPAPATDNSDNSKPLLIGPDSSGFSDSWWYPQFLGNMTALGASIPLDVVTWHLYLLGSGNSTAVPEEILNATVLNTLAPKCKLHHSTLETYGIGGGASGEGASEEEPPQFWLGEGGGAYGSGQDGATNTFLSTFWYADSLGTLAKQGHDAFCRQVSFQRSFWRMFKYLCLLFLPRNISSSRVSISISFSFRPCSAATTPF